MGKFIDLTGQRFGRLTAVERAKNNKGNKIGWLCICDCGNQTIVYANDLKRGHTKSCGCLYRDTRKTINYIHGHNRINKISPTYVTWYGMIQRCNNKNHIYYQNYGNRGIRVCEAWLKFEGFLKDMGERPKGMFIDRINNNRNYCKENCTWSTRKEQNRNKRNNRLITINNVTQCLAEWCEIYNLKYNTIKRRLYRGWTPEEALELTPRRKKNTNV
jgi:hypothetical protein